MSTALSRTARTREGAAKLAIATSSVAHVASGYARSRERRRRERHFESGFSRLASTIGTGGDR